MKHFFFPDGEKSDFGLLVFQGGSDSVDALEPVMLCSTASVRLNDVLSALYPCPSQRLFEGA